jgi:hypothetical protein
MLLTGSALSRSCAPGSTGQHSLCLRRRHRCLPSSGQGMSALLPQACLIGSGHQHAWACKPLWAIKRPGKPLECPEPSHLYLATFFLLHAVQSAPVVYASCLICVCSRRY